jgi:hypothetical protein
MARNQDEGFEEFEEKELKESTSQDAWDNILSRRNTDSIRDYEWEDSYDD